MMFHYSVVIKGMERKLADMGYRATVYKEDLASEVDRLAGRVALVIFYLPTDFDDDMNLIRFIQSMTATVTDRKQKLIVIGESKYSSDLYRDIPLLKKYLWLNRPLNMDLFENVVNEVINNTVEPAKHGRILIVDDDPAYAKIVREWIKEEYRVDIVTAGMQAITFLLKQPENDTVDLILLDYEMPVVDGPQVLQMLRQEPATADIPVIFLTGNGTKEAVTRVMELTPNGYLLKTTQKKEILKFLGEKIKK